jgi:hypothetical protein
MKRREFFVLSLAFVAAPALGGDATPTAMHTCSASACSELGWTNAALRGDANVCSAASAAGGVLPKADARCSGDLPWSAAVGFCEGFGARLCSQAETAAGDAAALGCELEAKRVWTSTSCGEGKFCPVATIDYDIVPPFSALSLLPALSFSQPSSYS